MSYYSIECMVPSTLEKKDQEKVLENIKEVIDANSGKIIFVSDVFKKKLVYEIKGTDLVGLVSISIDLEAELIDKTKESLRQIPAILRLIILKLKEKPEAKKPEIKPVLKVQDKISEPVVKAKTKTQKKVFKKPATIIKEPKKIIRKKTVGKIIRKAVVKSTTSKIKKEKVVKSEATQEERGKLLDEKLDELLKD